MPEIIKIPDAESEVMKVLWDQNKPMTERQILDVLSENTNWSPTTIKTLIKRLFDKGAIKREKSPYRWQGVFKEIGRRPIALQAAPKQNN